jgi:hypothetical protein
MVKKPERQPFARSAGSDLQPRDGRVGEASAQDENFANLFWKAQPLPELKPSRTP